MLDNLLLFLGLKSWYTDFYLVKKSKINLDFDKEYKRLKSVNMFIQNQTPSPIMERYRINITEKPKIYDKFFYLIYTFYSFLIFLFLCVQPIYTLVMFINNINNIKFLSSALLHLNIPLLYVWAKMYFRNNHLDLFGICSKFKVSFITISAIISIIMNFRDIDSFYNDYYWLIYFDKPTFFTIIIIEWLYSRLLIFTFVYTFIFIMNKHITRLQQIVSDIDKNEFVNLSLSNIIKEISKSRHEIEFTIYYFNNIISITTILGAVSLAIFFKDMFPNGFSKEDINFEPHDRYLINPIILYIVSNIILLLMMSKYSMKRESVLKFIKSMNFMNRFLCRIPIDKIMKKTDNNLNMVILNIAEETSITLDWMVLGEILTEKWLDFNILGISTSDGQLIKKSLALGGVILYLINFTNF